MLFRFHRLRVPACALGVLLLASCDLFSTSTDLDVVAYTGPDITQESVGAGWSAQVTGNQVVLKSPEARFTNEQTIFITLVDRGAALPEVEDIWIGRVGGAGKTLKKARVEISTWNLTGVISGALDARLPGGALLYEPFWVDLSAL